MHIEEKTLEQDVEELFTAYGRALVAGDVEHTVARYGFPCIALADDFAGTLDGPDALRDALSQASGYYAQFGVTDVRLELAGVDRVSEKITRVRLTWHFSAGGEFLVATRHEYTLRADPDGPRIYLVVAIDEAQQLAALAERLQHT